MNLKNLTQPITRAIGSTSLKLQAASPTLLTVGGIVALISAGVMAVKATPDAEPIATRLEKRLDDIEDGVESLPTRDAYIEAAKGLFKIYAPAIAVAAIGTASVLYGHGIMRKRQAALVAAYGLLERTFNAYRDRVRDSFGEEVEEDLYRGNQIKVTGVDPKTNVVSYNPVASSPVSEYSVSFDARNRHWNDARPEWNLVFLRSQEKHANHLLNSRGHVLLNDIYDGLGFPRTKAGAVVGWTRDGDDRFVDFGLPEAGTPEESDYFYFFGQSVNEILLDFNVDGLILDKLGA